MSPRCNQICNCANGDIWVLLQSYPQNCGYHEIILKNISKLGCWHRNYAQTICLHCDCHALNTETSHELAWYPTSMFDADGQMHESILMANFKNALKAKVSSRTIGTVTDTKLLDGCAILWVIPWPRIGTVQDYWDSFSWWLISLDIYFIHSDTYQASNHQVRAKSERTVHTLRCNTSLHTKSSTTGNTKQVTVAILGRSILPQG